MHFGKFFRKSCIKSPAHFRNFEYLKKLNIFDESKLVILKDPVINIRKFANMKMN